MMTTQTVTNEQRMTRGRIAEMRVRCQQHPQDIDLHRTTAAEFIAAGLVGEAIPILRRLANMCPDDAEISAQLAGLLTATDNHADAADLYRKLAEAAPQSVDALHNYGVAACHAERYDEATHAFERKLEVDPNNYETLNDLAVLYAMADRQDDAAKMYQRCLTVNPRYDRARENAFQFFFDTRRFTDGVALADQVLSAIGRDREVEAWKQRLSSPTSQNAPTSEIAAGTTPSVGAPTRVTGQRIGFVASSDAFLKPVVEHFGHSNQVRTFTGTSIRELAELLQWADLVWYEWCDQLVIEGSKLPRRAKTVCRLHSYEAFTNMPQQVNWPNIDHLILVSGTVGEILTESGAVTASRTVIHNGIDPARFPLSQRPQLGKKIASVGYINYKKNPSLLLQTFKAIHDWDPEFEFHIAGQHQDPRIKVYMDNLLPRLNLPITVHGWVADMPQLYAQMDFVISTSLFESFHYSIAEGMLSGCLPLIHSWRGADTLYPNEFLFNTPQEAIDVIRRCQTQDVDAIRSDNRNYISDRYNWAKTLDEIDRLLAQVIGGDANREQTVAHKWPAPAAPVSERNLGMVSVVIPVNSESRGVSETLDSVLNQTYQNTEVIVTADGSTDNLDSVLEEYASRMTIVRQVRRGCASAMNTAIQSAHGQFVALAIPGDSLAPQKLDAQLQLFERTPDLGIATCAQVTTDDSQPTPQNIAAAVDRCLGKQPTVTDTAPVSSVVFRRNLLDEIGWFEEYAPYADDPAALTQSLLQRTAAVSSVRHLGEQLVAVANTTTATPSSATAVSAANAVKRWTSRVTGVADRNSTPGKAPAPSSSQHTSGMTIALVGAHDPRGQMMMWAEALSQHTPHTVRVLTHTARTGCPTDLVINRRGASRTKDRQAPSALSVIEEAERVAKEAGLLIFAAGLAPGADRYDAQLTDTDEQPFGTLEWTAMRKGKRCAALLFGTPTVRHNLQWYRDHIARKGWPILTCDPDLHRWLPESIFIPRLLSRVGNRYAPARRRSDQVVVLHPGGRQLHDGGTILRDAAQRAKSQQSNLIFGVYEGMPWLDMLDLKKQAHVGFDRIAVGGGHFGIDSLENSALGLANIAYCDPYVRSLVAETLGTSDMPWQQPTSEAELTELLVAYARDNDRLTQDMTVTQQWFNKWWDERRLAPRIADTLEQLM